MDDVPIEVTVVPSDDFCGKVQQIAGQVIVDAMPVIISAAASKLRRDDTDRERRLYSYAETTAVLRAMFQRPDDRVPALIAAFQDLQKKGLPGRGAGRGRNRNRDRYRYSHSHIVDYVAALDLMQFGLSARAAVAKIPLLKRGDQLSGGLRARYNFERREVEVLQAISATTTRRWEIEK